jgi:thioredoxin-like negative regulator of GroEL
VWDYLTTPVALHPNQAEPWVDLGHTLARQGEWQLADRAFAAAFEAEPTNAQLLWDRARNLTQAGQAREAEKLYRRLAEGNWQPRFAGLRDQARWQLQKRREALTEGRAAGGGGGGGAPRHRPPPPPPPPPPPRRSPE